MYYGLIIVSVVMFGVSFLLKDVYRKLRSGSGLKMSLQFTLLSSIAGLVGLLIINGLKFEFTPFTFILSLCSVVSSVCMNYCGFKALGMINLSLYSVFMMLGGMVLPFLQGILFFDEDITVGKIVCFVFICVALALTVEPKDKKAKGTIYYIVIFVLNGMSGVFSKIFTAAPFEKTSAAGYSILKATCSIVVVTILLLLFFRKKGDTPPMRFKDIAVGSAKGIVNTIANFFLVIALAHVDASIQYPMVTGGVMIVSTLICFFGKNKPSKKELLAVLLSFIGLLLMFIIKV